VTRRTSRRSAVTASDTGTQSKTLRVTRATTYTSMPRNGVARTTRAKLSGAIPGTSAGAPNGVFTKRPPCSRSTVRAAESGVLKNPGMA
jgi:hypothetical protein